MGLEVRNNWCFAFIVGIYSDYEIISIIKVKVSGNRDVYETFYRVYDLEEVSFDISGFSWNLFRETGLEGSVIDGVNDLFVHLEVGDYGGVFSVVFIGEDNWDVLSVDFFLEGSPVFSVDWVIPGYDNVVVLFREVEFDMTFIFI